MLQLDGSLSEESVYNNRARICDLGFLRQAYRRPDGTIGWRCPGEKLEAYVQKGGKIADTLGRKCICNALIANVGLAQIRSDGSQEPPLVTCGDEARTLARFLNSDDAESYSAHDVIEYLLSGVLNPASAYQSQP